MPPNQGGKAGLSVPIVSWSGVLRLRSSLFEQLLAAVEVEPAELFELEPQRAEQARAALYFRIGAPVAFASHCC